MTALEIENEIKEWGGMLNFDQKKLLNELALREFEKPLKKRRKPEHLVKIVKFIRGKNNVEIFSTNNPIGRR